MEPRPLVLACEDEERIVELLRSLTEPLGVDLIAAPDGASALAHLAARRPALLILDLVLPNLDGFGVLERLRARPDLEDLPIVVVSALSDPGSMRKAYAYGVVDYVTKPFNVDLLDAKLRVFLRMHHLQHDLRRREQRAVELAASARHFAHEVRNPLAAISAAAQVIARDSSDKAHRIRLARAVEGEAGRVTRLVREYIERSDEREPAGEVDVEALLREVVEVNLLGSPALARIKVACQPSLPKVRADRDRLKQVVLNLLLNAVQATDERGTITLGGAPESGGVALEVRDTGCGIPATDLPRIFEETFSTRKGGGLGLPIARGIVESHGGSIRVESAAGEGTTFTVWLPSI